MIPLPAVLMFALVLAVLSSAVAVVYVKHSSRLLFHKVELQHRLSDRLDIAWEQLQLEQSTLADHSRIEPLARKKHAMEMPSAGQIILIQR